MIALPGNYFVVSYMEIQNAGGYDYVPQKNEYVRALYYLILLMRRSQLAMSLKVFTDFRRLLSEGAQNHTVGMSLSVTLTLCFTVPG